MGITPLAALLIGGAAVGGTVAASALAPKKTPDLPADPNIATQSAKAQNDQVQSLQTEAQGDTASIMARYGTRLALAGSDAPSNPVGSLFAPAKTNSIYGTKV